MTVRDAVRAFYAAKKTQEQVAALMDLGKLLGFERSGIAATVVKAHGHGKEVVDAMLAAAGAADGDPWEYIQGVFRNGRLQKANGQGQGFGGQVAGRIGVQSNDAPLSKKEQQTLGRFYRARPAAKSGGRTGNDAELDTEPVQESVRGAVQQPGDDDRRDA